MKAKPYYKESAQILKLIKKSKNILVNCHRNPDLDSVGCALAMHKVLREMGKRVEVVCPSEIPKRFFYLTEADKIRVVNFADYDYTNVDLLLLVDTSGIVQFSGNLDGIQPNIPAAVIDHHEKNTLKGLVKLVDSSQYSCAEIFYRLFLDWGIPIERLVATYLFAGISGDTILFSVSGYSEATLEVAAELLKRGADKAGIVQHIFRNYELGTLRTLGFFLQSIWIDRDSRIAYLVIGRKESQRLGNFTEAKEEFADLFLSSVRNVEVGIFFLEVDGLVRVGFRSRGRFDCGRFVRKFGGGGHRASAGAFVRGKCKKVIDEVLKEARRFLTKKSYTRN